MQQACSGPAEGIQPWNSLLLALSSDPQSLIVGSQLVLQERGLEWLGGQSAAIHSNLHVVASDFMRWLQVEVQDCILRQNLGSWDPILTN
jgi:hypothetical protein